MNAVGIIYIIKNRNNAKTYVGQTTSSMKERWSSHCSATKRNTTKMLLHKAMRKYGIDTFYYEILEYNISVDSLDSKEEFYIKEYNSTVDGYNIRSSKNVSPIKRVLLDENKVCELYEQGKSSRDIAKIMKVCYGTILNILRRNNITRRAKNCSLPDKSVHIENKQEIINNLLQLGFSKRKIARELSVDEKTIRNWINNFS